MTQEEQRETLTPDDLKRIYIRAQDLSGHWDSINCEEATDKQFDTWIRTRIPIEGGDEPWTPAERAHVCTILWQAGALHMLKKDLPDEEEQP